jgi:hypothetical protein
MYRKKNIKALTGNDASPLVQEGVASATGVITHSTGDGALDVYIENTCARTTGSEGRVTSPNGQVSASQSLDITTTSFDVTAGAERSMAYKSGGKDVVKVPGVGDEAILVKNNVGDVLLTFRKGRFIVQLTLDRSNQSRFGLSDPQAMLAKLTPFARSAADRIAG